MKNQPALPASEYPIIIWLVAGNLSGLLIEKCQIFKGKNVMLFPDLGAFEKLSIKASEIQKQCNVNLWFLYFTKNIHFQLMGNLRIKKKQRIQKMSNLTNSLSYFIRETIYSLNENDKAIKLFFPSV